MNVSYVNISCLMLLCLLGCDFEYQSSKSCSKAAECFRNETCQFDEEGVGLCRLADMGSSAPTETADGQVLSDSSQAIADMSELSNDVMNDMFAVDSALDAGNTSSDVDMSDTSADSGQINTDTSTESAPDFVCPSSDALDAVRFECTYPEMEQRRDYCQYFVSQTDIVHSCRTFCESIGLFTCGVAADCCWNNENESSCNVLDPVSEFTCDGEYESVICRCFEAAP